MTIEIRMPEISTDVQEADLLAWLVEPGDSIRAGDVLLEVETDKSSVEIECPEDGVLAEILVPAGAHAVAVGTLLARLEPTATHSTAPLTAPSTAIESGAATALARRIADQAGIELGEIHGTGARGRITRTDVERQIGDDVTAPPDRAPQPEDGLPTPSRAAEAAPGTETGSTRIPLSRMRRTIAERLSEAKRTIPHFYLAADCQIDALLEARREINATEYGGYKVSVNDFVIRATALALRSVPNANVAFDGDALIMHGSIDVAVAVATSGGLITPIIRRADRKGLAELSSEMRDLADRARSGKLSPKEYQGGGFSVSNLGMYGIDSVYPIVNPPHAGILGVGAGRQMPVARDGEIAIATVMTCTLAADHRAIDGAVGAEWLASFKRWIESPLEMAL